MKPPRIYTIPFAGVYPLYVSKVENKGRTQGELDEVVCWLTGYKKSDLEDHIKRGTILERFISSAPKMNPNRSLIAGVICGMRVENIEDPITREIRYMDKLVDELAKGKPLDKILRKES